MYSPTKENPSWQVNMMRGRDLPQCGFCAVSICSKKYNNLIFQLVFSDEKVRKYIQKYIVEKEIKHLQDLEWLWDCKH